MASDGTQVTSCDSDLLKKSIEAGSQNGIRRRVHTSKFVDVGPYEIPISGIVPVLGSTPEGFRGDIFFTCQHVNVAAEPFAGFCTQMRLHFLSDQLSQNPFASLVPQLFLPKIKSLSVTTVDRTLTLGCHHFANLAVVDAGVLESVEE